MAGVVEVGGEEEVLLFCLQSLVEVAALRWSLIVLKECHWNLLMEVVGVAAQLVTAEEVATTVETWKNQKQFDQILTSFCQDSLPNEVF